MKIGMKLYKWGMMMWLKGESGIKQLRKVYIYRMENYKETPIISLDFMADWPENIYIYIITWERTLQELFTYIYLHMIQNPHLHLIPCHLIIKPLQVIKPVASFTSSGKLLNLKLPILVVPSFVCYALPVASRLGDFSLCRRGANFFHKIEWNIICIQFTLECLRGSQLNAT